MGESQSGGGVDTDAGVSGTIRRPCHATEGRTVEGKGRDQR